VKILRLDSTYLLANCNFPSGRLATVVAVSPSHQLDDLFDDLDAWARRAERPLQTFSYGEDPSQELDFRLPDGDGPFPVAVVLHGGFWRAPFTRRNTNAVSVALTLAGWATANVEYRRLGPGAYEPMLADVEAARAWLGEIEAPLDLTRTVAVGHSAGGQLALWLAGRRAVSGAVALAGVSDLDAAARAHLGGDAVQEFLGGEPDEVPDAYALADPARLLPFGVPQLLVHGADDDRVPLSLSRSFVERARAAGDDSRILELAGAGHFDVIDPRSAGWAAIERATADLLA
jgi:acetyl esterase/lipase